MKKNEYKAEIKKKQKVRMEGSWGASDWEEVNMTYIIEVDSIKQYGFFEMYSDDGEYHAEGGLWFSKGVLYDYDGIFSLPKEVEEQLTKWGFKIEEVE